MHILPTPDDRRTPDSMPLPTPDSLLRAMPIVGTSVEALVACTRRHVRNMLAGNDDRLLVVMGPCSIHDPDAAIDYARRLAAQRTMHAETLEIVMRVYFEKPRTTIGWKGLINDPFLDGSCRIPQGLAIARRLLIDINRQGVPAAAEFLDMISPHYIGDLISWGAIGARTTESQLHRELASGLSIPLGFKNGTDGNVQIAIDAIRAAGQAHHFLSINTSGIADVVQTHGNPDCHVILRGGKQPNFDAASVAAATLALAANGTRERLMVDCSHGNCSKQFERQVEVVHDLADRIEAGDSRVFGVMIESHLKSGSRAFTPGRDDPATLEYGRSITDGCLGWDESVGILDKLSSAVRARRRPREERLDVVEASAPPGDRVAEPVQ